MLCNAHYMCISTFKTTKCKRTQTEDISKSHISFLITQIKWAELTSKWSYEIGKPAVPNDQSNKEMGRFK